VNSVKIALAIAIGTMLALPVKADTIAGGKVTSVNADGTSFVYVKKRKRLTFRITDKTVVRVGQGNGNVSDLKTGQPVKVEFQRQGTALTALLIGVGF
jgi:hypothetical protein